MASGAREPDEPYTARFFHATRALRPDNYRRLGILRLPEALEAVWVALRPLAPEVEGHAWDKLRADIESGEGAGDQHNAGLYRDRAFEAPEVHGGVFGFLLREVAVAPPGVHHDYTQMPEIVEDIVRCSPPGWQLGPAFMSAASPVLVHFEWPVSEVNWVRAGLAYLWANRHGGSLARLTEAVDTKAPVPPSAVLEVEILS